MKRGSTTRRQTGLIEAKLRAENRALRREAAQLRETVAAQRDARARYAAFMDNTTALGWMKDHRLRIVYVNPACARFRVTRKPVAVGQRSAQFFDPKTVRMVEAHDRQVLRENRAIIQIQTVPRVDGTPSHWRVIRFPYTDGAGRRFVGALALDITEYVGAAQALKQANEQTASILDHITDGFVAVDRQWRFTYINRHAGDIIARLGKQPQKLPGKCLWQEFADLRRTRLELEFRRAARRRVPSSFEFFYPPLAGWFHLHIYPADEGLVVYFNEITQRKEAEKNLRLVHGQVIAAQEAERRRVARELHDGVNQLLSTAQFRMQGIESLFKPGNGPLPRAIRDTLKILERAVREVRRISQNLRPSELDHLGLIPAIQGACQGFWKRTGIAVEFTPQRQAKPLPFELKLTIYRIVQEALTNVEKHSRARRVQLGWTIAQSHLHFYFHDNGCGFTPGTGAHKHSRHGGFGLLGMRERSALAGGELTVASAPGRGTRIKASLPIREVATPATTPRRK